jgi:hypothetical protein
MLDHPVIAIGIAVLSSVGEMRLGTLLSGFEQMNEYNTIVQMQLYSI